MSLIPEDHYSGKSITNILKKLGKKEHSNDIIKMNKLNLKQKKYIQHIARSLGSLIALLINIIDPQCVILGGGVAINNNYFNKIIIKHIREYIFAENCKKIPIINSKLKNDAALLGAAVIFKK